MEKYIPEGYKQTGIGEIPEDWVYKKISELTNIFGRIGFRGYTKRDIVEVGKGAISISPSNILDTRINYEKCTFISWYKYEESPEIQIVNNDVILVKTGSTFGKAALIHNLPNKATINPQLVVFKDIRIPNIYLSYLINSKIVQNQIQKNVVGGAIPTLSQAMVKNFVVPIPHSRREQESIARALSDVDNLISSLEQLIEKKKAIKQGTMQELLTGRRRLKGFGEGKGYKQTELGMIPEDWEVKRLHELGEFQSGIGFPLYLQGKHQEVIPFYKVSDMNNNGNEVLMLNSNNYISKKDLVKLRTTIVPRSSIVFAKIGAALFLERKRILLVDSLIDNNMMAIIADIDNIDVKYLYYLLMNTKLSKYANTTALPSINRNDIGEIKFKIPSLHEQEAITQVLTNMDSEIEKLESKVDKYKQIKQGMMQNLLTGRIRLV